MEVANLRQYRLAPSGCQLGQTKLIGGDAEGKQFMFCSTLALYVFDSQSFQLKRLIAGGFERNVTGMSWSRHDKHFIATICLDGLVFVWNLDTEQPQHHLRLKNQPVCVAWNPMISHEIALVCEKGSYVSNV